MPYAPSGINWKKKKKSGRVGPTENKLRDHGLRRPKKILHTTSLCFLQVRHADRTVLTQALRYKISKICVVLLGEHLTALERIHKILTSDDRSYGAVWRRKLDNEKQRHQNITNNRNAPLRTCKRLGYN
jgi:hypothetical protein